MKKKSKRGEKSLKNKSEKKYDEKLGVSGFTLGIVSIVIPILTFAPLFGIITSVIGFTLSVVQQRKNPTKLGKAGVIINVVGFLLNVAVIIILVKYIAPLLEQQLNQLRVS